MKFLITSDWHVDWTTAGMRRLADIEAAVQETVDYAKRNEVDVYCFLGDLMNPDSGSRVFAGLSVAMRAAIELANAGIESHWLAGNHDVIEDGTGFTSLSPMRALESTHPSGVLIHVHERPEKRTIQRYPAALHLERTNAVPTAEGFQSVRLLALPYAALARAYDPALLVETIGQWRSDEPLIVIGHMTDIPGITPGSESKDMPRGRGMPFPFDALAKVKGPKLFFNGHFHEQQVFNGVHIPGSLERLTFNEERNRPGWLVVEV